MASVAEYKRMGRKLVVWPRYWLESNYKYLGILWRRLGCIIFGGGDYPAAMSYVDRLAPDYGLGEDRTQCCLSTN